MPIPVNDAESKIRKLAEDSANVHILPHASERMGKRGIHQTEVIKCLKSGVIVEGPTLDSFIQVGWKVTMDLFCAGRTVEVAAKLVEKGNGHIIVITAISKPFRR